MAANLVPAESRGHDYVKITQCMSFIKAVSGLRTGLDKTHEEFSGAKLGRLATPG